MTNEEAADALKRLIYPTHAPYHNEVIRLAIAALRTPPATGAAAMREALMHECVVCHASLWPKDETAPHCEDCSPDDEQQIEWEEKIAAIRALPAPEVPECHGCKHWTILPFARDFEKQNQYGHCRGMRACGVEIETTGDCSVDAIGTDATFSCKGWEAR